MAIHMDMETMETMAVHADMAAKWNWNLSDQKYQQGVQICSKEEEAVELAIR